jgi:hypothetical protein
MILCWKRPNIPAIQRLSVFDAETGECLDHERIWFADDVNGLYYRHSRNAAGHAYAVFDPILNDREIASELVFRKIRIGRRPEDSASCP